MKIGLLVLLLVSAIGGTAIVLSSPDEAPINTPDKPCEPEPEPTPEPKVDEPDPTIKMPDLGNNLESTVGPKTPDEAEVWLAEVTKAMNYIRSRIEYKYQTSGRTVTTKWKLTELVRRESRVESTLFALTDFKVEYETDPKEIFLIICSTSRGRELAFGPLTMLVEFGSGESEYQGYTYAIHENGGVLLSKRHIGELIDFTHDEICWYHVNTEGKRKRYSWRGRQKGFSGRLDLDRDIEVQRVTDGVSLSVKSIGHRKLAFPISCTLDFKSNTWTFKARFDFYPKLPENPKQTDDGWWLESYVSSVASYLEDDEYRESPKAKDLAEAIEFAKRRLEYMPATLLPGDIVLTLNNGKVSGKVVSSWGRPLPFKGPSYTYIENPDLK